MHIINIILVLVLTYLLASNNLAIIASPLIGSRMLNIRSCLILITIAYALGIFIFSTYFKVVHYLDPPRVESVLITSVFTIFIGEVFKIPISLINSLYSGILGTYIPNVPSHIILKSIFVFTYWFIIPLTIFPLTLLLTNLFNKLLIHTPLKLLISIRFILIALSFVIALIFSVNNFGFLLNFTSGNIVDKILIFLTAILGSYFTGRRTLMYISTQIYTFGTLSATLIQVIMLLISLLASLLCIPISFSLLFTVCILSTAFYSSLRIINIQAVKKLIIGSYLTIPCSMLLSYLTFNLRDYLVIL